MQTHTHTHAQNSTDRSASSSGPSFAPSDGVVAKLDMADAGSDPSAAASSSTPGAAQVGTRGDVVIEPSGRTGKQGVIRKIGNYRTKRSATTALLKFAKQGVVVDIQFLREVLEGKKGTGTRPDGGEQAKQVEPQGAEQTSRWERLREVDEGRVVMRRTMRIRRWRRPTSKRRRITHITAHMPLTMTVISLIQVSARSRTRKTTTTEYSTCGEQKERNVKSHNDNHTANSTHSMINSNNTSNTHNANNTNSTNNTNTRRVSLTTHIAPTTRITLIP